MYLYADVCVYMGGYSSMQQHNPNRRVQNSVYNSNGVSAYSLKRVQKRKTKVLKPS